MGTSSAQVAEKTTVTSSPNPVVCLYHADCFDGTGAAWAVTKRFPDAVCIPVQYREPPPYAKIPVGADLYIVDFCYGIEELLTLTGMTSSLHVFDHHIGMKETIAEYNDDMRSVGWDTTHAGVFDLNVSGAKLTWQQLMPNEPVPQIIEHISDRDLWLFELESTKAVMAGLGSYALDLKVWDRLLRWAPVGTCNPLTTFHQQSVDQLEDDGHVILRAQEIEIERVMRATKRKIKLDPLEQELTLINVPRHLASEALALIAANESIAIGYFDSEHYREFSLRSSPTGPEVHLIARHYGGNGHARSAGFRLPRDHVLASV